MRDSVSPPTGRKPGHPTSARISPGDRPRYTAGEGWSAGRAPGRPKSARIPPGDRPRYTADEGLS